MRRPLKLLALLRTKYLGSDPKLDQKRIASQVGSEFGSGSKTRGKREPDPKK
jgi:hypothetical protein